MSIVTSAIQDEIKELVCEIIDVEAFEITSTRLFEEYRGGRCRQINDIRATLECAFGVTIDQASAATMINLEGVYSALSAALLAKHCSTLR